MRIDRRLALALTTPLIFACGKGDGPKPEPTKAPAATTAPADAAAGPDAATAKATRIEEGKTMLGAELAADGASIKQALELADALGAEDSPESKTASARIRLAAVARALDADPAGSTLGEGGAEKQLKLILQVGEIGGDAKVTADAARSILALWGVPDAGASVTVTRDLLDDASVEGQALRLVALGALGRALDAGPGEFETLTTRVGSLLCEGCNNAASLSRDQLGALVAKPYADGTGFQCIEGGAKGLGAPCDAVTALGPVAFTEVPTAGAPNVIVLAALELERALRELPPGAPPLAAALKAAAEKPARDAVALPVVVGELGLHPLGTGGLARTKAAIAIAVVGPESITMGTRPMVAPGGTLKKSGADLSDATAINVADLAALAPDEKTGALAPLFERANALATLIGAAGDVKAIDLAVLPTASPKVVGQLADALRAAGFTSVAIMRPLTVGGVLPLYLGSAPAEVEGPLLATWERPVLVVVRGESVDVWGPDKAKEGGVVVGADAQAELPSAAQAGWRGETLARLRVPIPPPAPERPRLEDNVLRDVKASLDFWIDKTKSGPAVHVVAGEGATSFDVLQVAQTIEEAPKRGAPQPLVIDKAWPGARCPGDATDCANTLVVAFSSAAVPNERGLSDKPKKGDKPPADKPEPTPPPSDEFCNKADIQTQMRKRAGSIRFCYEKELQLQKDLAGRVTTRFTIDLSGNVSAISASGDLPNKSVIECVKKEIQKVKFAPPQGGQCSISWPFVFKSE